MIWRIAAVTCILSLTAAAPCGAVQRNDLLLESAEYGGDASGGWIAVRGVVSRRARGMLIHAFLRSASALVRVAAWPSIDFFPAMSRRSTLQYQEPIGVL